MFKLVCLFKSQNHNVQESDRGASGGDEAVQEADRGEGGGD